MPVDVKEKTMTYQAQDHSGLLGTPGFSDNLLNTHFKLYQGYVANTNKLWEQLYGLQLKEKQLAADSKEDFFEVKQVREQIDRAKAILDEMPLLTETTEGRSRAYDEEYLALLQEEPVLAALQAKTKRLEEQRGELADQLRCFNDQDLRFRRLEREVELQDANYRQYVANLEQARIDQALEDERISSISIVQPASLEIDPVSPRPLLNLAVGLVLGVFGGVGVAFLTEYLSRCLRTPEDVERDLELKVLASVPKLKRQELAIDV